MPQFLSLNSCSNFELSKLSVLFQSDDLDNSVVILATKCVNEIRSRQRSVVWKSIIILLLYSSGNGRTREEKKLFLNSNKCVKYRMPLFHEDSCTKEKEKEANCMIIRLVCTILLFTDWTQRPRVDCV